MFRDHGYSSVQLLAMEPIELEKIDSYVSALPHLVGIDISNNVTAWPVLKGTLNEKISIENPDRMLREQLFADPDVQKHWQQLHFVYENSGLATRVSFYNHERLSHQKIEGYLRSRTPTVEFTTQAPDFALYEEAILELSNLRPPRNNVIRTLDKEKREKYTQFGCFMREFYGRSKAA